MKIINLNYNTISSDKSKRIFFDQFLAIYTQGISLNLWKNYNISLQDSHPHNVSLTFFKSNFDFPVLIIEQKMKQQLVFEIITKKEKLKFLNIDTSKKFLINYFFGNQLKKSL